MYRIVPQVVVRPRDESDIRKILEIARALKQPVTYRAAGTSLSGQAVGGGILVDLSLDWGRFKVEEGGAAVWAQPGVVGGLLNRALSSLERRIGPDPASIEAAMIGGIVANNASGMCCGTEQNAYRTIRGATIVLADGSSLDTRGPEADGRLKNRHPRLHAGLLELRDRLRTDKALANRVRKKFATKNTMGYSLHAFLDFDTPAEILTHLIVGSEGTLAFLSDVTLQTVPDPRYRATALVYFHELVDAGRAVDPLAEAGAAALEIIDGAALRSMSDDLTHPIEIGPHSAALLIEFQEATDEALSACVSRGERALARFETASDTSFSREPVERAEKWRLRKGILPRAGARRGSGLAILNEDVAFPRQRLAEAIDDLHALFARFEVKNAVVFGHAKDGNLHFIAPQDFANPGSVRNYAAFMEALAELVVTKYDGALKAEHGAGRNMAPYVAKEWGDAAYALMRDLKTLFDPYGILNPGVMLTERHGEHVLNLKKFTSISQTADRCIECGFCEPVCPTRPTSLTPRQRIVALREIEELGRAGATMPPGLVTDYAAEARGTCVRDSMCLTSCPVKIDTGVLMKELDAAEASVLSRAGAAIAAGAFGTAASAARAALRCASALSSPQGVPGGVLAAGAAMLHTLAPRLVPTLDARRPLPAPAPPIPAPARDSGGGRAVVYFPSCVSRIFGALPGDSPVSTMEATMRCLESAGYHVIVPENADDLCCGLSFSSKAHKAAGKKALDATIRALQASGSGALPVVTDASPCALHFKENATVPVTDFVQFWSKEVLGREDAPQGRVAGRAILHPTCSLTKLGATEDLRRVALAHADDPQIPLRAGCCGFAGNQGFVQPEITEGATRAEAEDVRALKTAESTAYSTCRTCEIGMTRATGMSYASAAHLVFRALKLGGS